MYLEKLLAGFAVMGAASLIWLQGSRSLMQFSLFVHHYADLANTVAAWGN